MRQIQRSWWLWTVAVAMALGCGSKTDLSVGSVADSPASSSGAGGSSPGAPLSAELRDVEVFINIEGNATLLINGTLVLDNSGGNITRQIDVVQQAVFLFQDDVGQTYEGPEPGAPLSVTPGQLLEIPFTSSLDVTGNNGIDINIFCGGAFTLADVDLELDVIGEQTLYVKDTTNNEVDCACC